MKFLGQYIQDFIARFRNDVYLEDVASGTIASGGNLGLDSNNKIVKADVADGDITSVVAGTGLSGGGTSGDVTLNVETLNQDTTGNAATATLAADATTLATPRAINGVNFDGSAPITITAAGSTLSDTVTVAKGGTGATSLTNNAILLGNGTGAVEASSHLSYSELSAGIDALVIGDGSTAGVSILTDNAAPLSLTVEANSGTNAAGGDLTLIAGTSTGNAAGGDIIFRSSPTAGSSGASVNVPAEIAVLDNAGNLQIDGGLTVGSTSFVNSSGVVQVATQGTIDHDSLANFVAAEHYRWDNDISGTATIHANNVPSVATTHATAQTGKHKQIFVQNFVDDLGTDKHFMPFKTNIESTQQYQEESCLIAPFDGRVVSVTIGYAQTQNNPTDITVGVETINSGESYANTWTVDETQTETLTGNHHVLHFVFDDAKHFDSTDKIAISIQQAADVQNAERFFWVSTIIEWDYSTALANDEYESTP
jgi:hypothetical protein